MRGTKKGTATPRRRGPVKRPVPRLGDPEWFAPQAVAARRRKLTHQVLRLNHRRYELTKNPLFVWEAITTALQRGARLPKWVTAYLGRVSARIGEFARTQIPRKNKPPLAVYQALEFGGSKGKNPFTALSDSWHSVNIALAVWRAMEDGTKPDFAIEAIVTTHPDECTRTPKCTSISRATVARAWRLHREAMSDIELPKPTN